MISEEEKDAVLVDYIINLNLTNTVISNEEYHRLMFLSSSTPKANTVVLGDNDVVVSKDYLNLADSIKKLLAQTDIKLDEKPKPISKAMQKKLKIEFQLQQAHKKKLEGK